MNNSNNNVPIQIIDTEEKLSDIIEQLKKCTELSFDTEFDDFNTQYGVHLQLIQVFDGLTCFLIDPLSIKNLDPLWSVFENKHICKLLYSGANDIAILKRYGCYTKNIFDIQVAAQLCNRREKSYSDLIHAEFGVEIDKVSQRSRWGDRPLKASQVIYACNDVIFLPRLKETFLLEISKNNMLHILQEEHITIEAAVKKDYVPKLNGSQNKGFNRYAKTKLMEFKMLINDYAKLLNKPPYYVVQDSVLEEILKDKTGFLKSPFIKGFYQAALDNDGFKKQFLEIVHSIDSSRGWEKPARAITNNDYSSINQRDRSLTTNCLSPFKEYIIARFGEEASTIVLKGLSKKIVDGVIQWEDATQNQRDLYNEFMSGT